MCFTPKISLATAIFEFAVAAFLYFKYTKSILVKFLTAFLFLLGFYQFTEFMLCVSGDPFLWGKVGLLTYTILPAIGLHFVLTYTKSKHNAYLIYLPVVLFSLVVLSDANFIVSGSCGLYFVSVVSKFGFAAKDLVAALYWLFYFGYVVATCGYLAHGIYKAKNQNIIFIYFVILMTIILTVLPPLVLIIIAPAMGVQFPSVYCQFAVVFAVMALAGAYLDNKLKSPFRKILDKIKK